MINKKSNTLSLLGKSCEDLHVMSAYLQDSIVAIKDMVFLKKNRTFIMIVNRFMWEDVEKGLFRHNKRIRCALHFEEVINVKSKNINQKKNNHSLECLTIKSRLLFKGIYETNFFFSGGSIITILSESLEVVMKDIGKPWKVKYVPLHKI